MEKTIKDFLSEMKEPERGEALINRAYDLSQKGLTEEQYLNSTGAKKNISQSLIFAFAWDRTPQGFAYWSSMCTKYNEVNQA